MGCYCSLSLNPKTHETHLILCTRIPTGKLPILVGTEIRRQGVVLNSLMQHQSEQSSSVGHSSPDITLLFEELVQLVPLWGTEVQVNADGCVIDV